MENTVLPPSLIENGAPALFSLTVIVYVLPWDKLMLASLIFFWGLKVITQFAGFAVSVAVLVVSVC